MNATAKVYQIIKAPKRIALWGDKKVKVESAEHIIEFPGGAVAVCRTTNGNYWAHIIVNRGEALEDAEGLCSARGIVLASRYDKGHGVEDLPNDSNVSQIAVLIGKE